MQSLKMDHGLYLSPRSTLKESGLEPKKHFVLESSMIKENKKQRENSTD